MPADINVTWTKLLTGAYGASSFASFEGHKTSCGAILISSFLRLGDRSAVPTTYLNWSSKPYGKRKYRIEFPGPTWAVRVC